MEDCDPMVEMEIGRYFRERNSVIYAIDVKLGEQKEGLSYGQTRLGLKVSPLWTLLPSLFNFRPSLSSSHLRVQHSPLSLNCRLSVNLYLATHSFVGYPVFR